MSAPVDPPSLRTLQRRASVASVLLAANAAMGLIALVPAAAPFFAFEVERATPSTMVAWFAAIGVIVLIALGTVVAVCMWFHGAAKNLRELEPGRSFANTPGWVVGWFFVPFANLIKPAHAAHEIWFWSRPEARDGDFVLGKRMPALLTGWWALWIASNLVEKVASRATHESWAYASALANIGAAMLCILVIREITSAQRARYDAKRGMPSIAADMGHVSLAR